MKHKYVLLLLVCICSISVSSQVKTIEYVIDSENYADNQSLTYTLEDGGLRIQGYMYTNCCGVHVIHCLVWDNSIFLSRSDMGHLCDCSRNHFVDFLIEEVPEGDYEVYLKEYGCERNTDDFVEISVNAVSLIQKDNYLLKYADGQYTVTLCGEDIPFDARVEIFDCIGRMVWECIYTSNTIQFPSFANLSICKITTSDNSYTIKLTKR